MKVVHAAKFYPPVRGGIETVVGELCRGTAGDWRVSVVAANRSRQTIVETCDGVRVVRVGSLGTVASVPQCPTFPMHLWREDADCLVLHEPNPIAGTALFLRSPAKRLVIWHHSDLVRPWWAPHTYGRLQSVLYRRADCVIASNPVLAAGSPLVQLARRVAVIPFGIDLARYGTSADRRTGKVRRVLEDRPGPYVLFVGRFVYYKGLEILIDAMARCRGTLVLVGEGPLEGELHGQVARLGMDARVVFAGRVPDEDLPAYYRASDVFVLPSTAKTEAFGVVQIEAMASGVPVVSTNLPTGVPWVNEDGVTGMVVPPGDVQALASALDRLIGDADLRRRFGDEGRRRARELFSRERMVGAFREVIEDVVLSPASLDRQPAHLKMA